MFSSLLIIASYFLSYTLASPITERTAASLITCLQGISGLTVVTSSSSAYTSDSTAFNRRITVQPAAIVYVQSTSHVSSAINCASSNGIPVSARSGGHSYAAYGLGGVSGNLVIDLGALKSITYTASTGHAVAGTGNRLGDLATSIYNTAQRALPHGTCPYVGTGGHTSFGGFGLFSRQAGLLLDTVVAADVVLANGTAVTIAQSTHPDLFWALKGAAPSFAIVTAWHYATLPAPAQTINWQLSFTSTSSSSTLASWLLALQTWAFSTTTTIPNALGLSVSLGSNGDGTISYLYTGTFYGTQSDLTSALAVLRTYLPSGGKGHFTSNTETNWLQGLEVVDGSLSTSSPEPTDTFFAKSLMISTPLASSAYTSFANYMLNQGTSTDTNWFVEIDLYGGAIANVASSATAYYNRDAILTFQLYASSSNYAPPFPSDGISFVNGMLNSITTNPTAAYPNYVDPTLTTAQWQSLYYGSNYARLSTLRKQYDPNQVFKFPQQIV